MSCPIRGFTAILLFAVVAHSQTITLDGTKSGRIFDGLGALSGGGATSRLLPDYPEPQRSEILDYLFKPNFGASLNIFKVEVGAGVNTTDGSEPSHEPQRGNENYQKGYEWWLMEQAKLRSPSILLSGLEWGCPGWIGPNNFWSQDNIEYLIRWIKHAKSDHGLSMDYMGGWNETGFNANWFIQYRKSLDTAGLKSVKLVAGDGDWSVAKTMKSNKAFSDAVAVIGEHYPCGWLSYATTCNSTSDAQASGKPLWASEDGSQGYNSGAKSMARSLLREYLDGKMTSSINWTLVWGVLPGLPYGPAGMILASYPWTGYYDVGASVWVYAHYTQFTQPGWQYIDASSGYFTSDHNQGAYVTMKSPTTPDWSFITEAIGSSADRPLSFKVTGGLSTGTVHVWASNLSTSTTSDDFLKLDDIVPTGGAFSFTLKKGYMYTFSTTTGQVKGTVSKPPPSARNFPLPYGDNFESYGGNAKTVRYFTDWDGTFETAPCEGGRSGTCLKQIVDTKGVAWMRGMLHPMSFFGDSSWTDYQIGVSVLFNKASFVQVYGRMASMAGGTGNGSIWNIGGYFFQVSSNGQWAIKKGSQSSTTQANLTTGTLTGFDATKWHRMKIVFKGTTIEGWVDNVMAGSTTDGSFRTGMGGIANSAWNVTEYDNYLVASPGGSEADTARIADDIQPRQSSPRSAALQSAVMQGNRLVLTLDSPQASDLVQIRSVDGTLDFQARLDGTNPNVSLDLGSAAKAKGIRIVEWTREGRLIAARRILGE